MKPKNWYFSTAIFQVYDQLPGILLYSLRKKNASMEKRKEKHTQRQIKLEGKKNISKRGFQKFWKMESK